jgi:MFS family permease
MRGSTAVLARILGSGLLRRVELAFAGFAVAEYGVWISMLVYAYERGGTTTAGLIAVLQLVPAAVVAPLVSVLSDRHGGAPALLLGYVIQAAAMAGIAALMLTDATPAAVYGLGVLGAAAVTLTRPAQATLLAGFAEHPDELTAATVVSGWVESASLLAGPALAGILIAVDGPGAAFAAFAAGVTGSALLVAPLARRPTGRERTGMAEGGSGRTRAAADTLSGIRRLGAERSALALLGVIAVEYLALGALDVLEVVLAIGSLHLGSPGAGYLNAAFGAGGVLGGLAALALIGSRTIAVAFIGAAIVWAVAYVALGAWTTAIVAFALLFLAGACRSVVDTAGRTLLARITPSDVLGRAFGVMEGLSMAGLAAGSLLVPALVALGGVRLALIGVAAILAVAVLAPRRRLRALDRMVPAASGLRSLRANPLFAGLPAPVLEGLARELEPVYVEPGEHVVRQGEPGDRFYLVAEGELDVVIDDEFVRTLTANDGFGEIALLRNVPRTATVVARTPALLYGLAREPFLEAVAPAAFIDWDSQERVPTATT